MDQQTREIMENEAQQKIVAAIWQAAREGQPVSELYEAIKAGKELSTRIEQRPDGTCVLVISADRNA